MSGFDELIQKMRRTPGMYLEPCTVDAVCAYLQGYDAACEGGVLRGFREWLIVMINGGNNLTWQALASSLVREPGQSLECEIDKLFELVIQFRSIVNTKGIRRIMVRYQEWLECQPWYGAESPDFL